MDAQSGDTRAMRRRPLEINVQARTCDGGKPHCVGDLINYRSSLWMVKGFYLGSSRAGQSELYYILSEASPSLDALEDA